MATKTAARKRKDSFEITSEFEDSFNKNFNCADIELKKMFPLTPNQKRAYFKTQHANTNMVFINGPAGSSKTYIAVYSALELLKDSHVDQVVYIRSAVESSSRSIGALPGELHEKFSPYSMPLIDKLGEILNKPTYMSLLQQEYVKAIPVNFVRGLTFHKTAVIVDEAQNMNKGELTTILTRFGRNSKYFICGDSKQSDIKDSGFEAIYDKFDSDWSIKNEIYCETFEGDDINRSPILKHITAVLDV